MIGWIGNSYSGSYGEKDLGRNGYRGCKGVWWTTGSLL